MEYYCFKCKLIFNLNKNDPMNCENCNSEFIEIYNTTNIPNKFKIYDKKDEDSQNINRTLTFSLNDEFVKNTLYPLFHRNFENSRRSNLRRLELNFIRMILESNLLDEESISYKTSQEFINNLKLFKKNNNKEEVCSICKDNFNINDEYNILPCNHNFHKNCLIPWLEMNYSCPNCRLELPKEKNKIKS